MKITTLEPTSELNSVIDKYWHCIAEGLNSEGILIPMMNHKIVIDFSDQVIIRWEKYDNRITQFHFDELIEYRCISNLNYK